VAAQVVASRAVLSSTELVSNRITGLPIILNPTTMCCLEWLLSSFDIIVMKLAKDIRGPRHFLAIPSSSCYLFRRNVLLLATGKGSLQLSLSSR
jgi:hypothetical protein